MSKWNGKLCPTCSSDGLMTVISDGATYCSRHANSGMPRKRVTDGVTVFDSLGECCREHGISRSALAYRIKSQSGRYELWGYLDEGGEQ